MGIWNPSEEKLCTFAVMYIYDQRYKTLIWNAPLFLLLGVIKTLVRLIISDDQEG